MGETVRRFGAFLWPSVTIATLVCLILAVALQQELRQAADDPQHQLAEDAVGALQTGASPSAVVGAGSVDVAASLAPFVTVFDTGGLVIATSGQLDGAASHPPAGVLDTARTSGFDRVTWQPRAGVRVALVVLPWTGGTVLAGRSLRRVEQEESAIEGIVALGWLGTLAVVGVAALVSAWLWPKATGRGPETSPRT